MITFEEANSMFRYEPSSGHVYWKVGKFAGRRAGSLHKTVGYRQINTGKKYVYEHRVIMLLVHGSLPKGIQVDHINHDRSDNRLENLRLVTHTENGRNAKKISTNTTGVTGVTFCKLTGRYQAQMHMKGKCKYLGQYDTLEEAATARLEAEIKYGFHENHGT